MSDISIHYDIRVATANLIKTACGTGNLIGLKSDNVKVRMMPKVGEVVDPLPCIIVAPVMFIAWEPLGFEYSVNQTYGVEFALVAASNQDYLANQEKYEGWLQAIGKIIVGDQDTMLWATNPACPTVWRIMIDHSATFDRSKLAINYAYQSILGMYDSQETWN